MDSPLEGSPAVEEPAVAREIFQLSTRKWTAGSITVQVRRGGSCGNREGTGLEEKVDSAEFFATFSLSSGDQDPLQIQMVHP